MYEEENAVIPRRVMVLFVLVDTSGSMQGSKIGQVNSAMEEIIPLLKEVSDENADAEIKVAVMEFSTGVQWVTKDIYGNAAPAELDEGFFWNDLTAGGLTEMGACFTELEKRLSRTEFLKNTMGAYAPAILLLSDGMPNDEWKKPLTTLQQNNWFKAATKIAIAIGADAGKDVLAEFTGSAETVVSVDEDRSTLKRLLSRLAVVTSKIVSHPGDAGGNTKSNTDVALENAKTAIQTVVQELKEDGGQNIQVSPLVDDHSADDMCPWDPKAWESQA